jgi:hypothetical protein
MLKKQRSITLIFGDIYMKTVHFPNDDSCKDELIAMVTLYRGKGVMVKGENGNMITYIKNSDDDINELIRDEVIKIMTESEKGRFYQPDWSFINDEAESEA